MKKITFPDGSKAYFCVVCDRKYSANNKVHRHFRTAHPYLAFKCHVCAKNINGFENLEEHVLRNHTLPYTQHRGDNEEAGNPYEIGKGSPRIPLQTKDIAISSHTEDVKILSHTEDMGIPSHPKDMGLSSHTEHMGLSSHNEDMVISSQTGNIVIYSHTEDMSIPPDPENMAIASHTEDFRTPYRSTEDVGMDPDTFTL